MNTMPSHTLVKTAKRIVSNKLKREIPTTELQNIVSKKLGQTEGGRALLNSKDFNLKDLAKLRTLLGITF